MNEVDEGDLVSMVGWRSERPLWGNKSTDRIRQAYFDLLSRHATWCLTGVSSIVVNYVCADFRTTIAVGEPIDVLLPPKPKSTQPTQQSTQQSAQSTQLTESNQSTEVQMGCAAAPSAATDPGAFSDLSTLLNTTNSDTTTTGGQIAVLEGKSNENAEGKADMNVGDGGGDVAWSWRALSVCGYDAEGSVVTVLTDGKDGKEEIRLSTKLGHADCDRLATLFTHTDPSKRLLIRFNYLLVKFVQSIVNEISGDVCKRFTAFMELCLDMERRVRQNPETVRYIEVLKGWKTRFPDVFSAYIGNANTALEDFLLEHETEPWFDTNRIYELYCILQYKGFINDAFTSQTKKLCQLIRHYSSGLVKNILNIVMPIPATPDTATATAATQKSAGTAFVEAVSRLSAPDFLKSIREVRETYAVESPDDQMRDLITILFELAYEVRDNNQDTPPPP